MPVAVLGLFQGATWTRFVRSAVLDVIRLDYVTTARSKGLPESGVVLKHIVRNAMIPVVTLIALQMPIVFGGAIITEQIFRVPGIGSLLISAILANDTPVIMGGDVRVRLSGHPVQPDRGPAVWLARPSHLLPLTPRTGVAVARARHVTPWTEAWRRFRRHRLAVVSAVILLAMMLAVAFGPLLWRVQINDIDFAAQLQGPSWAHPLGTDDLGQDLLARMLYGGRISLAVGLAAMSVSVIVGTIVGAIAGMARGSIDAALVWLIDLFLSLPQLPVLLLLIYLFRDTLKAYVGPEVGIFLLIVVGIARLPLDDGGAAGARAVLRVAREGVRRGGARPGCLDVPPGGAAYPAERAGSGDRRRHDRRGGRDHRRIDAVVSRPGLPARHSDLGPHPVRRQGHDLDIAPHWAMFAGGAIFLAVLTINFIGDGLRDALDPRRVM